MMDFQATRYVDQTLLVVYGLPEPVDSQQLAHAVVASVHQFGGA
jgi:hypothetical protein